MPGPRLALHEMPRIFRHSLQRRYFYEDFSFCLRSTECLGISWNAGFQPMPTTDTYIHKVQRTGWNINLRLAGAPKLPWSAGGEGGIHIFTYCEYIVIVNTYSEYIYLLSEYMYLFIWCLPVCELHRCCWTFAYRLYRCHSKLAFVNISVYYLLKEV